MTRYTAYQLSIHKSAKERSHFQHDFSILTSDAFGASSTLEESMAGTILHEQGMPCMLCTL